MKQITLLQDSHYSEILPGFPGHTTYMMASISKGYTREIAFDLINNTLSTIDDEVHPLFTEWDFLFTRNYTFLNPHTSQKIFLEFLEQQLEILSDIDVVLPHDWTPYLAMHSFLEYNFPTVPLWPLLSNVITKLYTVDTHTIDSALIVDRYRSWLKTECSRLTTIKSNLYTCTLQFVKEYAWCYIPVATHSPIES